MLGKQIQLSANDTVNKRVEEKLNVLNRNWDVLQERALCEVQLSDISWIDWSSSPSLISTPAALSPVHSPSPDSANEKIEEDETQQRAHLKYQLQFSELFDWLSSCDESLSQPMPSCTTIDILKSRIFQVQVI